MDRYEASLRYVKILLFFVILLALAAPLVQKYYSYNSKKLPGDDMQIIESEEGSNSKTLKLNQKETPEDTYVHKKFNEYLSSHPDVPPDNYEEIKQQIRNEFREKYNMYPVEIQETSQEEIQETEQQESDNLTVQEELSKEEVQQETQQEGDKVQELDDIPVVRAPSLADE